MTDRSSYICDPGCCHHREDFGDYRGRAGKDGVCWHEEAWYRLRWQYGDSRANTIALGLDKRTKADIAAWNGMGR